MRTCFLLELDCYYYHQIKDCNNIYSGNDRVFGKTYEKVKYEIGEDDRQQSGGCGGDVVDHFQPLM